jgi:hypothetical protein
MGERISSPRAVMERASSGATLPVGAPVLNTTLMAKDRAWLDPWGFRAIRGSAIWFTRRLRATKPKPCRG